MMKCCHRSIMGRVPVYPGGIIRRKAGRGYRAVAVGAGDQEPIGRDAAV